MSSDTATPAEERPTTLRKSLMMLQTAGEAAVIGLAIGAWDANSTNSGSDWLYLVAGIVLGWRHLGVAWFAWLPLGTGLYFAHRIAIARGYVQPFVESDALVARHCIWAMFPSGIGLALGSVMRIILVAMIPRVGRAGFWPRVWPRNVLGLMLLVAKVAATIALVHWSAFGFLTVYAPGFSEGRFRKIQPAMTPAQVEELVGRPLDDFEWGPGTGTRNWTYSRGVSGTANYCRRWVLFHDGRVTSTICDDWID